MAPRIPNTELASPSSPAGTQCHRLLLLQWPLEKKWWVWLGSWWDPCKESQQRSKGWGRQLHPQGCLQGELALGKALLFPRQAAAFPGTPKTALIAS